MAGKPHVKLKTIKDINQLLRKMINERLRGERDSETARTVGYIARILIESMKTSELEDRLR